MASWIFLRGLTRQSEHWGAFLEQFRHVLPGQTIVPLDLAGNGVLNSHRSRTRVQDMVIDCRAQLQAQGLPPPYHLLAMSLGAMVAVAWAQAKPDEVAAQVLINTSLRPYSAATDRLQPSNYATLLRLLLSGSPLAWERAILHMTSNRPDEQVLPFWLGLRKAFPVSRLNALRQLWAAARFIAAEGSPAPPTLLLASTHDRLVSVVCSHALAHHWRCPLLEHPSAGHDIPLDDGIWVATSVRTWHLNLHNIPNKG